MAKITPVEYPLNLGIADNLEIAISANYNVPGANVQYHLTDSTTVEFKILSTGVFLLSQEEFEAHGGDKQWVLEWVCEKIGVELIKKI